MSEQHDQEPRRFRFRIRGHLGAPVLRAFAEMESEIDGADTLLTGVIPDWAALYGAIAQIERLGLELLGIRLLSPGGPDARDEEA